ncbi:MAG: hypothetical protein DRN92_00160 [Thermoproteota archaeon]|nr:MAG: hypothetical protein DRN92_00160 [Candidatus Korarchaeota archaeon]
MMAGNEMEQTDRFETSIYRIAISLIVFGLGLLSTLFVISMVLFIREMGKESSSVSSSMAGLIVSITKILPLTIALAAAIVMLSKGLSLLIRVKDLSEDED